MNSLTGDMTRLCDEILAWRGARSGLLKNLTKGVIDLRTAVSAKRTGDRKARTEMARKMRTQRVAFVSSLRNAISNLRKETAADLAAARRAWRGK